MTFARRHHQPAITMLLVVLFWFAAATLIIAIHAAIDPRSPAAGSVATIVALLVTGYAYSRFVAQQAGIAHALGVGSAWLLLSIAAEVIATARAGRGWFALLGSPDRPLLRNVLLFVWIFAPALFARREELS
jgi:hypothetical protein